MGMTSLRLDEALDRDVNAAAAREGVSVSEFIRAAVRERAERVLAQDSLWDRIRPIVDELDKAHDADRVPIRYANPVHEAYSRAIQEKHRRR